MIFKPCYSSHVIQELEKVQKALTARIRGMKTSITGIVGNTFLSCHYSVVERIIHMWKVLHDVTTNDLNIHFVSRPRLGNVTKISMVRSSASAANPSIHERLFAAIGPKLWNTMPYHLNLMSNFDFWAFLKPAHLFPDICSR